MGSSVTAVMESALGIPDDSVRHTSKDIKTGMNDRSSLDVQIDGARLHTEIPT